VKKVVFHVWKDQNAGDGKKDGQLKENVMKDVFTVEKENVGDVMKRMDINGPKMLTEKDLVLAVKERLLIGLKLQMPTVNKNVVEIMKNSNITIIPNAEKLKTVKVLEPHTIPQENVLIVKKDVKNAVVLTLVTNVLTNSDGMVVNVKDVEKDVILVPEKKKNVPLALINSTLIKLTHA